MKFFLAVLAFTLVPTLTIAQQSGSNEPAQESEGIRCGKDIFNKSHSFVVHCLEIQRKEAREAEAKLKEIEAKLEKANEQADELRRAADIAKKLRSPETGQQIDGVFGAAGDINSHGNSNPASKEVTEKGLSVLERIAHQQNEILDHIESNVQSGLAPQAGSTSPYSAGQHQLNEPTKSTVGPEQLTVDQRIQNQQEKILSSAPTVKALVEADRAQQARWQAEDDRRAKEEAEQRRALAKAEQEARLERAKADAAYLAAADAADVAAERRARRAAAEWAAAAADAFRRSYSPSYYPYDVPPAYGSSYGVSSDSSFLMSPASSQAPSVHHYDISACYNVVASMGLDCILKIYKAQDAQDAANQKPAVDTPKGDIPKGAQPSSAPATLPPPTAPATAP